MVYNTCKGIKRYEIDIMAEPSKDMNCPKLYGRCCVSSSGQNSTGADCCKCPVCRMDVAAYALNRLPSKYVATREGEVYSKLLELEHQFEADVVIAIMKAIEVVRKNPRHKEMGKGD